MKRIILAIMPCLLFINQIYADNTLQIRQLIGEDYLVGYYHNEPWLGTEVIYNNKPWLLIGAGPRYILKKGENELKLFGYLAFTSNVAKKHWPIEKLEIDSFVVPKIGNWSVYLRTRAGLDLADSNSPIYGGEDYIGYQVAKALQIQLRTEWKCQNRALSQSIGCGWSNKVSTSINFNGYVGVETKRPYSKTGWIELRCSQ